MRLASSVLHQSILIRCAKAVRTPPARRLTNPILPATELRIAASVALSVLADRRSPIIITLHSLRGSPT